MAVKPYTIIDESRWGVYCRIVEWVLGNGDTGQPIDMPGFQDKTVQMSGTFGAAVTLEGSNDKVGAAIWSGLADPQGTAISMSAQGIEAVLENPYWIRPNAGAVTSVTVRLCCVMSRR